MSFSGLTEFRGANSASSSQPIICVQTRTHRVCCRTHRVLPENSVRLSEFSSPKQYSRNSIPLPFPRYPSGLLESSEPQALYAALPYPPPKPRRRAKKHLLRGAQGTSLVPSSALLRIYAEIEIRAKKDTQTQRFHPKIPCPNPPFLGAFNPRNSLCSGCVFTSKCRKNANTKNSGKSGKPPGKFGELPGKSGKLPGNPWIAVKFHSERTSGEVAEKLPGKLGELPGKSGDFPEARGSLTASQ